MAESLVLKGNAETIIQVKDLVKKLNGSGKYKFHYDYSNKLGRAKIVIDATDPMHFYMLGVFSQDIMKKLFNEKLSRTNGSDISPGQIQGR
jgi:hypothetical protein